MMTRATLISIGDELIRGVTVDTNAAWLARRLHERGWQVLMHHTVGDDRGAICDAVRVALKQSDLIVITGGLGPTADDVTRDAIADALNSTLQSDPSAESHIKSFFQNIGRELSPTQMRQSMIPVGCDMIPNPWGTAPGIAWRDGTCLLYALPGVPLEMKNMFDDIMRTELHALTGDKITAHRTLWCFGTSEADIGERIAENMRRGRNPNVGITASDAILGVRISAYAENEDDAQSLLHDDVEDIKHKLGQHLFGYDDDTMASVVAHLLTLNNKTVATAESCTGGLLAKKLTDIPGASGFYKQGYVTYDNCAKTQLLGVDQTLIDDHGAVSEPVAKQMAEGCHRASGCDFAIALTGIAGPDGGEPPDKPVGLVYIGLCDGRETVVRRFLFGTHLSRHQIRERACTTALNMLRKRLKLNE